MSDLPKGWVETKLGEVSEIVNGGTPHTNIVEFWEGEHLWITPKDMGKLDNIYVDNTERKITEAGLKNSSAKILPINSIILSSRAPIGYLAINKKEIATNQGCKGIVPKEGLLNLYIYYFLKNSVGLLQSLGTGTTFKELSSTKLSQITISLPPLNEQRRIVAKLDTLFSHTRKAREELDRIPDLIKRYKQAVLSAACSGKLTEDWREENKISKSWELFKAEDICSVQCGSTPKGKPFTEKGDIPYLKVYNIVDQKISFDYRPQFIPYEVHQKELSRCITLPDDVLMNIVGPPLGKVAIVTNQFGEWNINQALVLFRPKELILRDYLYYFLREGQFVRKVEHETKGSVGQINISLTQCRNCLIPLPSLPEQQEIVKRVEEKFKAIEQMEAQYQKASKLLDRLEQATLSKAFRGELVPQDPNDEPASVLLERILAEKQPKKKAEPRK